MHVCTHFVMLLQELPQRLRLDAVRGLKHIKEAALELTLPDNTTKTGVYQSTRLSQACKSGMYAPDDITLLHQQHMDLCAQTWSTKVSSIFLRQQLSATPAIPT
jgi:hypothetical protein